jgi:hypothetical protein
LRAFLTLKYHTNIFCLDKYIFYIYTTKTQIMKKILSYSVASFLIAGMLIISSCTKGPLTIYYNLGDFTVNVPANPYNTYQVFTYPISHDSVAAYLNLAGKTTNTANVTQAIIQGLQAQMLTTGVDFSQITGIEVYLKPVTNTTTVGDQVAYAQNLGAGVTLTTLAVNGTNELQLLTTDCILTVKVLSGTSGSNALSFKLTQGVIKLQVTQ